MMNSKMDSLQDEANGLNRKDGGERDLIAFDNPDDQIEDIPKQAQGNAQSFVAVDSPDDFSDEGS